MHVFNSNDLFKWFNKSNDLNTWLKEIKLKSSLMESFIILNPKIKRMSKPNNMWVYKIALFNNLFFYWVIFAFFDNLMVTIGR